MADETNKAEPGVEVIEEVNPTGGSSESYLVHEHLQKMPSLYARGLLYILLVLLGVGVLFAALARVDVVIECPMVLRLDLAGSNASARVLWADIFVSNRDAAIVEPGMAVRYKLHALPVAEYGTRVGRVLSVAEEGAMVEGLGIVFHARGGLDRTSVVRGGKEIRLKAGMTGTAELVRGRKSLLAMLAGR